MAILETKKYMLDLILQSEWSKFQSKKVGKAVVQKDISADR